MKDKSRYSESEAGFPRCFVDNHLLFSIINNQNYLVFLF